MTAEQEQELGQLLVNWANGHEQEFLWLATLTYTITIIGITLIVFILIRGIKEIVKLKEKKK